MLVDSLSMVSGAVLDNGVIESGAVLPLLENSVIGQLFYLNAGTTADGLYVYDGAMWKLSGNSNGNTVSPTILSKGLVTDTYQNVYTAINPVAVKQLIFANVGDLDANISISINQSTVQPSAQYEIFHAAQLQYGQTIIIDTNIALEANDSIFIKCDNGEAIINACFSGVESLSTVKLMQATCNGSGNVISESITENVIIKNFMLCNTGTTDATIKLWMGNNTASDQLLKDLTIAVGETVMGDFNLPVVVGDIIAIDGSTNITVTVSGEKI